MTSPSRRRAEAAFEKALGRPPEERERWLARALSGDEGLLREVRALLAAHERAEGILDTGPDRVVEALGGDGPFVAPLGERRPDDRIGAWRVTRELGRGGMGVVYRAERADGQFRQQVAIKVIRGGPAASELHRRFEAERQILAALDHPNIGRLYDGGITEDGRPYLVMEHVKGLPIDRWADLHGLEIDARLRLFCTVARAVHYAHRNLVVHRDLKPSNILVTEEGVPKLLDFGIAKILDPTALGWSVAPVTRTGLRLMTPEYASPEQVRGDPVTTGTDVYSLGVILYELLTGLRPFDLEDLSPAEAERIVAEEEPLPPSEAVLRPSAARGLVRATLHGPPPADPPTSPGGSWNPAGVDPDEVARQAVARSLRRRLRGELDRIVLMALRKEPERRYASAAELADDIERHLTGLPVHAHRDSRWYRLRKLIRRHRVETAAAALVSLSLLAGSAAALSQARRARQERDGALQARVEAERALTQSRAVTDFLIGLFEASRPGEARGDTIRARDLLRRGTERAEGLASEPEVQALMLGTVGEVYENLGELQRARPLLERALELRRRTHGDEHPDVALGLRELGNLEREAGALREAEALYREALEIQRGSLGREHLETVVTMDELAYVLTSRGRMDDAEALRREALEIRRSLLGPEDPLVASSLENLGRLLRRRGAYDESETLLREALSMRRRLLGGGHPHVATSMLHLGSLVGEVRGTLDEAELLYRQALAILRRARGPDHPDLVWPLGALADLLAQRGRHPEAEALYREAFAIRKGVFGPDHPLTGESATHLAAALRRAGKLADAERWFRRGLEIQVAALGDHHLAVAGTYHGLGDVVALQGRLEEAEALARRGLEIREGVLGEDHPLVAALLSFLGELEVRRARYAEAEALYQRAHSILTARYDETHPSLRTLYREYGRLYEAWGRPALAERYRSRLTTAGGEPAAASPGLDP